MIRVKQLLFLILNIINLNCYSQDKIDSSRYNLYPLYYKYIKSIPEKHYKKFTLRGKKNENKVVLTFDDGPNYNTQRTINYLVKNKIPATFFVSTKKISSYNANYYDNNLIEIALHGYDHDDFRKLSKKEIQNDFRRSFEVLNSYLLEVKYYRSPYGIITDDLISIIEELNKEGTIAGEPIPNFKGIRPVLWSVDSQDWAAENQEEIIENVTKNLQNGDIILFHEASTKVSTIEKIVIKIKELGFEIVQLDEIL